MLITRRTLACSTADRDVRERLPLVAAPGAVDDGARHAVLGAALGLISLAFERVKQSETREGNLV